MLTSGEFITFVIFYMHDIVNSCTMQSQGKILLGRRRKINRLLFMDDLKLYGKTESEIEGLVSTEKSLVKT